MNKQKRLYEYVRVSLIFIIVGLIVPIVFDFDTEGNLNMATSLLVFAASIFNFVNCIRYLANKFKPKALVITSLVITSLLNIVLLLSFLIGVMIGLTGGI